MHDRFGRQINYLRISVTDRCNLRCVYCMPAKGVPSKPHGEILSYEEMVILVTAGVKSGIRHVRITGGEPLVREGLIDFIRRLKGIPGIKELALTTNGILLAPLAAELKAVGLDRVNISLDTLERDKFAAITRRDRLKEAWQGIEAALAIGLDPVKINTVALKGVNEDELVSIAKLTLAYPLHVRFIEVMPLGSDVGWARQHTLSLPKIKAKVEGAGKLFPTSVPGAGPAQVFCYRQGLGTIGFIAALSNGFCQRCNRMRLTADGKLKPCLASDLEVDVKEALRRGADEEELQALFKRALVLKPSQHYLGQYVKHERIMHQIGG